VERLPAPLLGRIPFATHADPLDLAACLDVSPLLKEEPGSTHRK
jgi:hypothetical protein